MRLTPHPRGAAIHSPAYSAELRGVAQIIPGMVWDAAGKCWAGPQDAVSIVAARLGLPTPASDSVPTPGTHISLPFDGPLGQLRTYQKEAVVFLLTHERAILADDMGLGKTATALAASSMATGRTLIVCPNYVRGVWRAEALKWLGAAVVSLNGAKNVTPVIGAPIIMCHYDILHAWAAGLADWGPRVVIFDEAHALMSEGSQRSKAARKITEGVPYVWGLTGTPLTNRPRDLWNVVDTICPGRFGKFFSFGLRYCAAEQKQVTPMKRVWVFDGKSNEAELGSRLKHFMIRRTKSDVSLELPPKTRQLVWVDVKSTAAMLSGGSPAALRKALDASTDKKLSDVSALVLGHVAAGHKVVAFTWRKAVAEMLANEAIVSGHTAEVVHGGIPTLQRGKRIDLCKNAPGGSLLATTIDSSGTGIDLSYADVCIFAELTWEPHKLLQAEARLHRYGQANPVLIQYVVARNTSDEIVASVVVGKLDTYEAVMGTGDDGLRASLSESDDDIMAACSLAIEGMRAR